MEPLPRFCSILSTLLIGPFSASGALDEDGNGHSDIWENTYQASGLVSSEDADHDGVSNGDEATAGTNPFDPDSKLTPRIVPDPLASGEFWIEWLGQNRKEYSLWSSPDLSPGSWTLEEQWTGTGDIAYTPLTHSASAPLFLRLEVTDVDTDGDGLTDWEETLLGYDPETANSMRLPTHDYTRAAQAITSGSTVSIHAVDSTTHEAWPDPAVFAIRRSGGVDALTINLEISGTATPGSDYSPIPSTVEIPFGSTTVWVEIIPEADSATEGDESVTLAILAGDLYSISSNGTATVTIEDATGAPSEKEAARFLTQATFGPTPELIQEVQTLGIEGWIDNQFSQPIGLHQPILEAVDWVEEGGGPYAFHKMRAWWEQAMNSPDPLRQRIAFALSEILVISDNGAPANTPRGMLNYYDMLLANSFGNYRNLLEDVTYHPCMGIYLSHQGNQPPDPELGRFPDENYAREIMQLFTIGLWMLNADGTKLLDSEGQAIPTYDNDDITNLARVFTGMSWGAGNTSVRWEFFWPDVPEDYNYDDLYVSPMNIWNGPYEEWTEVSPDQWESREVFYHDQESKTVLGTTLPANDPESPESGYASADVDRALDVLFNHPNIGPFVSRLLIQRLVTSNPSPEYIERVSSAFSDNGQGIRGDMQAVVKAILLDSEARDLSLSEDPHYGMQKEPYLRFVSLARAFDAASESGIYEIYWIDDSYGMTPLSSPSVFNFFSPDYQPSGPSKDAGLVAPEFQITNEVTGILTPN
ncbi:MAG: DUF1800 family protein, partial [Puniceicoccales bacterium]